MKKIATFCIFFLPTLLMAQYQVKILSSSNGIANGKSQNYNVQIAVGQQLSGTANNNNSTIYMGLLPLINGNDTSVDELLVSQNHLFANYPNPWYTATTIPIRLHRSSEITLQLYNSNGKLIRTIAEGIFDEGYHYINLINNGMSPGVYIYRLQTSENSITRTMLLE